jgi:hypothetical protein
MLVEFNDLARYLVARSMAAMRAWTPEVLEMLTGAVGMAARMLGAGDPASHCSLVFDRIPSTQRSRRVFGLPFITHRALASIGELQPPRCRWTAFFDRTHFQSHLTLRPHRSLTRRPYRRHRSAPNAWGSARLEPRQQDANQFAAILLKIAEVPGGRYGQPSGLQRLPCVLPSYNYIGIYLTKCSTCRRRGVVPTKGDFL